MTLEELLKTIAERVQQRPKLLAAADEGTHLEIAIYQRPGKPVDVQMRVATLSHSDKGPQRGVH